MVMGDANIYMTTLIYFKNFFFVLKHEVFVQRKNVQGHTRIMSALYLPICRENISSVCLTWFIILIPVKPTGVTTKSTYEGAGVCVAVYHLCRPYPHLIVLNLLYLTFLLQDRFCTFRLLPSCFNNMWFLFLKRAFSPIERHRGCFDVRCSEVFS